VASIRMYNDLASCCEGWSKALWDGLNRDYLELFLCLQVAFFSLVPWLMVVFLIFYGYLYSWTFFFNFLFVLLHLGIRLTLKEMFGMSERYWWLFPASVVFVLYLFVMSFIKIETGVGWTWKGRKMELHSQKRKRV